MLRNLLRAPLLRYVFPLAVIASLSLLLLGYLAYGEARLTYRQLVLDNAAAQGSVVQDAISTFLLADLPLTQFPGFQPLTASVLASDQDLAALYVTDTSGSVIFSHTQPGIGGAAIADPWSAVPNGASAHVQVAQHGAYYRVSLPLNDKVETVGYLQVALPAAVIDRAVNARFRLLALVGVALVLAFSLLCLLLRRRGAARQEQWIALSFAATFTLMGVAVIAVLTTLYASGIQDRSTSLARSLAARLDAPLQLGLSLDEFTGLDSTLAAYKAYNPDISFIALTQHGRVLVQTSPAVSATSWQAPSNVFESDVPLTASPRTAPLVIRLGVPQSQIYARLWQSVKNFAALLVAALLLSTVFFTLRRTLSQRPAGGYRAGAEAAEGYLLGLVGTLYFLTVFAESLNNSFLPQHFRAEALSSNISTGVVATLFTTWYLAYAVALLPAGMLGERFGTKPLFIVGNLCTALNLLLLTFVHAIPLFFLCQLIDGLGQGMVFIGVQSFIIRVVNPARRTRGAALIVFGFNGGLIAGNSIGSLLSVDAGINQTGVFLLGSLISAGVSVYALTLMPNLGPARRAAAAGIAATRGLFWQVLRDRQFLSAALLVGVPTKIVMAGLISASLPLVLAQRNYATQDIGQILMIYSGFVLISSRLVAHRADQQGRLGIVLLAGMVASAGGLFLMGLIGWPATAHADSTVMTLVLIAGTVTLGIGHGCIQAPILSYVSDAPIAQTVGQGTILSFYRLVERLGNVSGPIIVSQVLVFYHFQATGISVLGLALLVFIPLFWFGAPPATPRLAAQAAAV